MKHAKTVGQLGEKEIVCSLSWPRHLQRGLRLSVLRLSSYISLPALVCNYLKIVSRA